MQKPITLFDYKQAFDEYASLVNDFNLRLFSCGSVSDPGVSDIDCILVGDSWECLVRSTAVLNPEGLSPLFVHGPFVCTGELLPDLLRYTTLRIEPPVLPDPVFNVESQKLVVSARQSGSLLHFDRIMPRVRSARQDALMLKSLLYTFRDCYIFFEPASIFQSDVESYAVSLGEYRFKLKGGYLDARILDYLKSKSMDLHHVCVQVVADWVIKTFGVTGESSVEVLRRFQNIVNGDSEPERISSSVFSEFSRMRDFRDKLNNGYIEHGALWRGAEYPFHGEWVAKIGKRIWMRRLIKRYFSVRGRMIRRWPKKAK